MTYSRFLRRILAVAAVAAACFVPDTSVAAPSPVDTGGTAVEQPKPKKRTTTRKRSTAGRRTTRARRATPAVAPAAGWTRPRGASALSSDLGSILSRKEDGHWGAMVVSLTRGDTLFALAPDDPRTPASTLKMFTSVLALDRLGPNWQFSTDVLRDGAVGGDGTLAGNLYLRGDGDPALSKRWVPGPGLDAPMQELADKVAAAGIKHVKGDLVADASAFESRTIPDGWLSRYAGSGYAAPFSALSLNENIVVVAVYPDGRVVLEPATTGIPVENQVKVTGGGGSSLHIYRSTDGTVVARGSIGKRAAVRRLQLTVADPPRFTAGALRAALASKGITVDGQLRMGQTPANASLVASHKSPPISELIAAMNRESINHFAELLFRNAVRGPKRDTLGSAENGNALLQRFMTTKAGASANAVSVTDGCGLSVLDHVTPRAMIQMLAYAHKAPWSSAFHASLPVAGESELLRNRMKFTPAQGNLHAKTGTTNDVIGLGGYVTAENGEVLAFSFLFNGHDRWNARATIDRMGATMAAFSR
ncbi:D-alanyl-D-alanine carboxypeptidase/D-alanyl-D-alanine-endopeptidase [Gemmatirosa kalamazoonensis]|uniref:D-alanyl-D-alanine carboxypeptidase/D-alanyl-D-alanine-endopeptidase n=1 Tax=Gemmatirosa kalamazoonensis TaxID=861299 RepID=W0RKH8_9BACT|nr:D-alanyl-D-alanine carboxypeptidase/D-alanyl-D-alanine-endopeptidase [Gemmatirosa kalamazoonensis]AHG89938.1 D-alanyl-D-alanine carboxypeptidase/D-alanyl-D-alanine-endopeptidase [Gemmatirosa kalamazoonensis]